MADLFIDERLKDSSPLKFVWLNLAGAQQAEICARGPVEAVLIDMQHGLLGYSDMLAMVAGVHRNRKPAFVRPPLDDFATVSRALDAGVAAIIMPMVNSVEDAQKLVNASKYPPLGERSWGPFSALNAAKMDSPAYLAGANQLTKVFAMIETAAAFDNLDAICAVEGLDGVFVGPNDLSISLSGGKVGNAGYKGVVDALPVVVASAEKSGKVPGIFAVNGEQVQRYSELGFRFISCATDVLVLNSGIEAVFGGDN